MIASIALLLQLSAAIPASPASTSITIKRAGKDTQVPIVMTSQGKAVRSDLVAKALGSTVVGKSGGKQVFNAAGRTIEFAEAYFYMRVDTALVPLAFPAFRRDGATYLPLQVVTDILPRLGTGLMYDTQYAELRVFNTVARTGTPEIIDQPWNLGAPDSPAPSVGPVRRASGSQRRLVVVDAGHGGVDNGMTGPIGGGPQIKEKYITLAVARLVAQELRNAGVEILMTRTTDTLIALSDRGRIANRAKGDLFVSIHVNATGSRASWAAKERGFETYFLAEAKTEEATRVERMENEAVKFETGANAPKGDPLSFIINDMAQNEHLRESNDLAETIQQGVKTIHPGPSRGVQQANFAVLRGSYMPAVLVEIGFGTNPDEAAWLSDSDSQRTIARTIAQSVLAYLEHYESRIGGQ
jgi:N-acetylmuramoyl-L-alanine amidase